MFRNLEVPDQNLSPIILRPFSFNYALAERKFSIKGDVLILHMYSLVQGALGGVIG
jgi:hypothetical protein